ncbi:flagellar hook-associated protein FlgL [Clostridium lacusfryxellense]|uniref:flagellar hook-associated protein FlgL n=1 Tax=Clostridium lacusfryxellense TaxID=205328 RepID=UPI001C0C59B5|nr:flagellar hook-associated protein FlgL [Clostridium lacusfryxellense]MBU3111760.1 flagellar hook-associated protein FlgL [Clostridium lacusfryxellense]
MRVTNKMLSNNFLRDMNTNLNNLSALQNQMASAKQINKASDDPVKAAKIMQLNSDIGANEQYNTNIKNTTNWLDVTDSTLDKVGGVITRINELLVASGGAGYGADEKSAVKDEINQRVEELAGLLNTSFDGKYIFGGTSGTSKPVGTSVIDGNTQLTNNTKAGVVAKNISGTMTYSGNTVKAGDSLKMSLNGVSMTVVLSSDITSGSTSMEDAKSTLETDINAAIATANTTAGKTTGQVGFIKDATVTATADGRFEISSQSGTITFFNDDIKTTAKDLGISAGLKDKLMVEVSQGVTMDYNVTASQVINYGVGGNNIMDLMANITKHLSSDKAADISALNGADLTGVQTVMTNLLKLRSEVGAKQNRMESAESRNTDQNLNMTEILTSTQDIDITEKSMEYATMQTIYLASLQTSAKVLQPTLLDYLR